MEEIERMISSSELATLVPYSLTHIYRLEQVGQFPRRVKLGSRRVGWLESEVRSWLKSRADRRGEQVPLTSLPIVRRRRR